MTEDLRHSVAGEVRAEMARQRKTGLELSKRLGVSHATVSDRLTGKQDFKLSELAHLADWLGVPITQFLPKQRTGAA